MPVSSLELIRGLNLTVQTSKLKFSYLITNCVDCFFWRFSMIFAFTAICNKLFKLKLPKEFQSICTCIFVQLIKGLNLTVQTSKLKFSIFITNCVDCVFWRFSMIFAFNAICNKLFKLKLPKEFQSICTCIFVTTYKRAELDSSDIKVEIFRSLLQTALTAFFGDFR